MCLFEFIRVEEEWSLWNMLNGAASYKSLGTPDLAEDCVNE
jgi:hypothetical protein